MLIAPVLKAWLFIKPLLFKITPAAALWLWVNICVKAASLVTESAIMLGGLLGGWKAWSAKKIARHTGRFAVSLTARFIAVSVLLNMLFGDERKGVKKLPQFTMLKLRSTRFGKLMEWWAGRSERQKRLVLGVLLCVILILAGQALLGISVLLFDLLWELVLLIWRWLMLFWRLISPIIFKLLPNFIGNFITKKVVPFFVNLVPVIKDDHRVMYVRFNLRRHFRSSKAWLYLKSRERRQSVRSKVGPLVAASIRAKKDKLLDAAADLEEDSKGSR